MAQFRRDTVKMQFVTAIYELEIRNYSQYSNSGMFVHSPCFNLLDRNWSMKIYPDGDHEEAKGYISIFLQNEEDSEVKANSTFVLVNQQRERDSKRSLPTLLNVYAKKGKPNSDLGHAKFFKQSLLTDANSQFIVDDTVIFRVEINIYSTKTDSPTIPKLGSDLRNSLNIVLFESGVGSDVEIVVANTVEKIPAHKCVLMVRSPVFKAMFTHNMSESSTNEIVISDFSSEVVREMLHFMYTDKLQSETLDNTVYEGLLGAAIKYIVPGLINLCERHFCSQLSIDNVLGIYTMGDRCGSTELTAQATAYIKRHGSALLERADFQPLLDIFLSSVVLPKDVKKKTSNARENKKQKR